MAAILVLAVSNLRGEPITWDTASGGNGHVYDVRKVESGETTWHAAREETEILRFAGIVRHLATLTSAAEAEFVHNLVESRFDGALDELRPSSFWLGGVYDKSLFLPASGWMWISGESWDFTRWAAGEPNERFGAGGGEAFLSMWGWPRLPVGVVLGMWNDAPDAFGLSEGWYVVEWDPAVVLPPNPVLWASDEGGNGHSYELRELVGHENSWSEANRQAQELIFVGRRGHLASLTSADENSFVAELLRGLFSNVPDAAKPPEVWLGGYQVDPMAAPDAGWQWVTGEPWDYSNWDAPREPNDFQETPESHLVTWLYPPSRRPLGTWNDATNARTSSPGWFVVEWEPLEDSPACSARLGFEGPLIVEGGAGSRVQAEFHCMLSHTGTGAGIDGWSFGLLAENAEILRASMDGTDVAELLVPSRSLASVEVVSADNTDDVVVSAVVLDAMGEITLDPGTTTSVLRVVLEFVVPESGPLSAALRFTGGLRGSGQPVDLAVVQEGRDCAPILDGDFFVEVRSFAPKDDTLFVLGVDGSDVVVGCPGVTTRQEYLCTLTHQGGGTGPQGWSFGLEVDNARIVDVTFDGTDVAGLLSPDPLVVVDRSADEMGGSVVTAVILDPLGKTKLAPLSSISVLRLVLEFSVLKEGSAKAVLRFVDGLRGKGQPVNLMVVQDGREQVPIVDPPKTIEVRSFDPQTEAPFVFALRGDATVAGCPGTTVMREYFCTLTHRASGPGPQGWSFGVRAENATISAPTTVGTDIESVLAGNPSLSAVELTSGEGNEGVISSVILDTTGAATLPSSSTATVLRFQATFSIPEGGEIPVAFRFTPGLQGRSQPVEIVVVQDFGECSSSVATRDLEVAVRRPAPFIRGDVEPNGRLNIADSICILGYLFLGSCTLTCLGAADVDDSGGINIADAIRGLCYLFLGCEPPPAPFPECAADASCDDGVICEDHGTCAEAL